MSGIQSALHEAYGLKGKRVHWFTEDALDHSGPFVSAICGTSVGRPIISITFESGIPYCQKCERKAANV